MTNAGLPYQEFIIKQDMPCGGTIGPMLSSKLGCHSVDVGMAQLAMHSIRETCGTMDSYDYARFFEAFYGNCLPIVDDGISFKTD